MTGCGESYFSAFAIFLKASTAQIGFIASVPTLLASFAQILSAWLGHHYGKRKSIIVFGAALQALVWLPLMALPVLFPNYIIELLIVCLILYHTFSNLIAPQWASLMGELVSENKRGRYFARRTAICSMTSFIALILGGIVLHYCSNHGATLAGFIIIFSCAFIARLISVHHLKKMHDPSNHVAALENPFSRDNLQEIRHSPLFGFSLFLLCVQFSVSMASPFFSVYLLRDLHFSYIQFMACSASTVLFQFLALQRWGRISDIFGNRIIMHVCGLLIPLLPFFWLLYDNFYYLLIVQAFGGFIWAGFSLSASNYLYELIPQNKRATWMAAHNVIAGFGIFLGALTGGWLGTVLPNHYLLFGYELSLQSVLYNIFILSFVLRLSTMLIFLPRIKEQRKVRRTPLRRLVFRVIRFSPLAGFNFEVIGSRKVKQHTQN